MTHLIKKSNQPCAILSTSTAENKVDYSQVLLPQPTKNGIYQAQIATVRRDNIKAAKKEKGI